MRIKEIKVRHNGKNQNLPFHFGFNTQADFCEDMGITITDFDKRVGGEEMRMADIRALAWHAMHNGHKRSMYKDSRFAISKEDVGDMFDETPNLITEVFKALVDAQPAADPKEGDAEGNG
jgi:hypothetical protein